MSTKRDQVLFRDFGGVLHPDAMYLSRQGPALGSGGCAVHVGSCARRDPRTISTSLTGPQH